MSVEMIRELYQYHWWANRRLFEAAAALGEEAAGREVGKQFSVSTLRGMFAHLYGADWIWLNRWRGNSPPRLPAEADFASLADLRRRWDEFEPEQRAFIEALSEADLARTVDYKDSRGRPYRLPLGPLLQHVVNHATHHRSEASTMITMISGSPPPTDLSVYLLITSGQMK